MTNLPVNHVSSRSRGKTAVIGDLILDSFVDGVVRRMSPEAPVPVLVPRRERDMPGGAANVAANVEALGGCAMLLGVIGQDPAGDRLVSCLERSPWVHAPKIIRTGRWRTPHKTRYCADRRHLLRVDCELDEENSDLAVEGMFSTELKALMTDAGMALLSDYRKGTLSVARCAEVMGLCRARGIPVLVDSKASDWSVFSGAALLAPNLAELTRAAGEPIGSHDDAIAAARRLMSRHVIAAVVVTMAADGLLVVDEQRSLHVPSSDADLLDVTGAGDTVVAGLAVALGEGATLVEAARFANAAAGLAVARRGTSVIPRDDVSQPPQAAPARRTVFSGDAADLRELCGLVEFWRASDLRIGFTNGCFDVLHAGHLRLVAEAAARCDRLIVAVNRDSSVRKLKGPGRPVQSEEVRLQVMSGLPGVSAVVGFAEDTPLSLLETLKPDVLVKGADYELEAIVGAQETLARGGEVIRVPLLQGQSTSAIVKRLREGFF